MSAPGEAWGEANQRQLSAELARVRELLEAHAEGRPPERQREPAEPAALEHVCNAFQLSAFERDLLLLCAGIELDGAFASACAAAGGEDGPAQPSFSLALGVLPGAHWSALASSAPLRSWRLIEVGPAEQLTAAPLRIDETTLHFLAGVISLDQRLEAALAPLAGGERLTPSQRAVAAALAQGWLREPTALAAHVSGVDAVARRDTVAAAAAEAGVQLYAMRAADVPVAAAERATLARLWERQALLASAALLIECDDLDPAEAERSALAFAEQVSTPVALAGRGSLPATRPLLRVEVGRPEIGERELLWRRALEPARLNGALERIVAQFELGAGEIEALGGAALARAGADEEALAAALWEGCRAQARPGLGDLAERIEPAATWEELVLPGSERRLLRDLVLQVRHRDRVHRRWGFALQGGRGLGISALFAGPSGTGKTMAAEVLAGELELDLYRIDLATIVSKYIGETEKNLRRVFDAAERGGAVLLFDEADALFGKRSEVRDSHDRYANIEVGYLLQRIEAYRGLAILTTNMRAALDPAFLRRLRAVVQFPRPDLAARREIWRRAFPRAAPLGELDLDALARLDVSGGAIRNIALRGAFLAAEDGGELAMGHLAEAARSECAKLERPLDEAQIGGWA